MSTSRYIGSVQSNVEASRRVTDHLGVVWGRERACEGLHARTAVTQRGRARARPVRASAAARASARVPRRRRQHPIQNRHTAAAAASAPCGRPYAGMTLKGSKA
eukprot:6195023-Pleurochrysis_carterae.AAC.2